MTITAASFRADYRAFRDPEQFGDDDIDYWLNLAGLLLNSNRWGNLLDTATELFIAHNLSVERRNAIEAKAGAPPGRLVGGLSSAGVGPGSVAYDTGKGIPDKAGHWGLTNYGTRLLALIEMVGAGPIQIGTPGCSPYASSAGAWPGPPCTVPAWFAV